MKTKILLFIVLLTIAMFTACSNSNSVAENVIYSSKDEAIDKGLTETDQLLSTESYKDVTLVFFERDGVLGVSILTEKNGEFRLIRNEPFHGFESDSEYMTSGYEIKIDDDNSLNILAGKVFDHTINQIILEDNKTKLQVEIWNKDFDKSELFYFVLGEDEYIDKTTITIKN